MATNWKYRAKPGKPLRLKVGDDITVQLDWDGTTATLKIDQRPRHSIVVLREDDIAEKDRDG